MRRASPMSRISRFGASLLALCACCMALGHAQQREPSFRVSSELVVIDLVAVDRQGRFITDLRPDEIEVKEDGKRQAVQLLRLVGQPLATAGPARAATTVTPPSTPPSPSAEGSAGTLPARRLAVVVDTLSLTVDAVPRVRQSLLATIADLPAGLPVLIATIGPDLQITQPFTTDRAVLRQAVSALPTQLDPPAGVALVFSAIDRICASAVDQGRVVAAAIEAGERMVFDAQARSAASSEALGVLADRFGALAGRKHLVLYSSGYAIPPGQSEVRGSGQPFCVSGPFPDTTIEGIIDGVVVGFHGVQGRGPWNDVGVWFPTVPGTPGPGAVPRAIPLYPQGPR